MGVKSIAEVTVTDETDIDHLTTWYLRSTSPTRPSAPADGSAPASPWTATEPAYDASLGTTYLYTVQQTVWGDGSLTYGAVQLSSAYEAAKAAWNYAHSVETAMTTEFERTDEEIALRATKTEAYQTARPNLAPISAAPMTSIYNATTNPNGYWKTALSPWYTQLEDGWVHVYKDNSEGTADANTTTFRPRPCPSVVPGETYTILIEVRNNRSTGSGNTDMYIQQTNKNQFWGSGGGNIQPLTFGEETVIHSQKVADTAHLSGDPVELFRYNARCAAGSVLDLEFRLSLYEGIYDGPYKPYAGPQIFATQAELKVTADGVSSKVSKDDYNGATIVSYINQSADTVRIEAEHVEVTGAAVFSAINGDTGSTKIDGGKVDVTSITVGDLSDGDDYATKEEAQGYADDIQVGGRNLLLDSATWGPRMWVVDGSIHGSEGATISGDVLTFSENITGNGMAGVSVEAGMEYTLSVDVRSDAAYTYDTTGNSMVLLDYSDTEAYHRTSYAWCFKGAKLATEWVRISETFMVPDDAAYLFIRLRNVASNPPTYQMRHMKLERGNKPTDWTPAPEDVDGAISSVQDSINSSRTWYANCSSAAGDPKVATITPATTDFSLSAGTVVYVKFSATNSLAVASLTLNVNGTGAKAIKRYGTTNMAAVGNITAGMVCQFVYDGTNWLWVGHVDTNTTYNLGANQHSSAIKAKSAVTRYHLICGDESGYQHIAANATFDLTYPILYPQGGAIAANATATNTYETYPGINFSTTGSITSGAANKMLYLKGTVNGNTFTVAASAFLTTVKPTTEDGFVYLPLGIMTSATAGYFQSSKDLYAYKDGAFGPVSIREASAAAKTATNYISVDSTGIRIASSNPATATTYQHQTATETEFVVGGTSMAEFGGSGSRMGSTDGSHVTVDNDSVDFHDGMSTIGSIRTGTDPITDETFMAFEMGEHVDTERADYFEGNAGLYSRTGLHPLFDGGESTSVSVASATAEGSAKSVVRLVSDYYDDGEGNVADTSYMDVVTDLIHFADASGTEPAYLAATMASIVRALSYQTYDFVSRESGAANYHLVVAAGICHCYFQGGANTRGVNHQLFTLPAACIPKSEKHIPFVVNSGAYGHAVINPTSGLCTVSQISASVSGRIYINASWPVV